MVAAVLLAGAVFAGVMALASRGYWRYSIPTIVLLNLAVTATLVQPLLSLARPSIRWVNLALGLGTVATVLLVMGLPSIARVRADLETMTGRPEGVPLPPGYDLWQPPGTPGERADAIVAARCTHVAGTTWFTGPVVFLANLKLADRGEDRIVWGLALRPGATAAKWKAIPRDQVRIGLFTTDRGGNLAEAEYGEPLRVVETIGPLEVAVPDRS
jgi:hypothetical protein